MRYLRALLSIVAVSAALSSNLALSQGSAGIYPSKPVTLISPTAASGPIFSRDIAPVQHDGIACQRHVSIPLSFCRMEAIGIIGCSTSDVQYLTK